MLVIELEWSKERLLKLKYYKKDIQYFDVRFRFFIRSLRGIC